MPRKKHPGRPLHLRTTPLGRKITAARKGAGLTQADCEAAAGLAPGSWVRYETGSRLPDWPTIQRIARILDITVGDLE